MGYKMQPYVNPKLVKMENGKINLGISLFFHFPC
jgi:hypothetical protein